MYVTYDMYPHGLKFLRPVTAVQGLRTTAGYGTARVNSVRTAYLRAGNERISAKGFASPAELQAATTYFYGPERIAESHEWILNHFSRYILVSGVVTEVDGEDAGDNDDGDNLESIGGPPEPVELKGYDSGDPVQSGPAGP